MTTPTVLAANSGPAVALSDERLELVSSAIEEIEAITSALRTHIETNDAAGTIKPLARGMLARVQALADSILESVGTGDGWAVGKIGSVVHARRHHG